MANQVFSYPKITMILEVSLKFTVCELGKKGYVLSKNGVFSSSIKTAFEDERKREEPKRGFSFKKGSV